MGTYLEHITAKFCGAWSSPNRPFHGDRRGDTRSGTSIIGIFLRGFRCPFIQGYIANSEIIGYILLPLAQNLFLLLQDSHTATSASFISPDSIAMTFESELIQLAIQLQSLDATNKTHEDVQAAVKELAPKTRAQAAVLQKFLSDTVMLDEPEQTKPEAVATSSTEESESEPDNDTFDKVPRAMKPWANVSDRESTKAWLAWEVEQGKHHLAISGNIRPSSVVEIFD